MAVKKDREYRDMTMEIRTAENEEAPEERKVVRGYASTFNEPYTLFETDDWRFNEVVDARAFNNTDMSDVIMQYDHEGRVFARASNDTLRVAPDEVGVAIEADLGGTELGRQIYDEVRGGYTNKMSVGMKIDRSRDVWTSEVLNGKTVEVRRVMRVAKLYDVSAVSIPANDATSISVRSLVDGVIERLTAERQEAEKLELERRRAEVRARALTGGNR